MGKKRFLAVVGAATFALTATFALAATASGKGNSPAQLQRAGWDCLNPAPFFPENPNVHCFPPGQLEAVVVGTAVSAMLKAFATPDPNAEEAQFLGTEHMILGPTTSTTSPSDRPARRPARRDEQSAELPVQLALPAVRLGLLHLPPLRQPLVIRPESDQRFGRNY